AEALAAGLDVCLVLKRERHDGTLICINKQMSDFVMNMERTVLGPLLQDDFRIAVYGNNFFGFVVARLDQQGCVQEFSDLLLRALRSDPWSTQVPLPALEYLDSLQSSNVYGFINQGSIQQAYTQESMRGRDQGQVLEAGLAKHLSAVLVNPLNYNTTLRHELVTFDIGVESAGVVMLQVDFAEVLAVVHGFIPLFVISNGASVNVKCEKALTQYSQFYRNPADRLPGNKNHPVCYPLVYYKAYAVALWVYCCSHTVKNVRNNLSYSQKGGSGELKLRRRGGVGADALQLVDVDWIKHQQAVYDSVVANMRFSMVGVSEEMFEAVKLHSYKMKVGPALQIFSRAMQDLEDFYIDTQQSAEAPTPVETRLTVQALQALRPLKMGITEYWYVMNGKDLAMVDAGDTTKLKLLGTQDRRELLALRSAGRLMDDGAEDIRYQLRNNPNCGMSLGKNYITDTTQRMVTHGGYGMAGFVEWYTEILRPKSKFYMRAASTNDYEEMWFGIVKHFSPDTGLRNLHDACDRAMTFAVGRATEYVDVQIALLYNGEGEVAKRKMQWRRSSEVVLSRGNAFIPHDVENDGDLNVSIDDEVPVKKCAIKVRNTSSVRVRFQGSESALLVGRIDRNV
ncbi:hypothetical protein B484DRAFT_438257, partial [Ochromonadaceae sp. CCMP2298]